MSNFEVWILICGQIRNTFELAYTLQVSFRAQKRNAIKGIVLSTWTGECEKAEILISGAKKDGLIVIENPLPERIWGKRPDATALYQMISLHHGLAQIPEDAYVLKTRTELMADQLLPFLNSLEDNRPSLPRAELLNPSLITTIYASNFWYYDISDTHFFGKKKKIMELVECGVFLDSVSTPYLGHYVAEQRIWGNGFIRRNPIMSLICRIIDVLKYRKLASFYIQGDVRMPKILIKCLAIYYADLIQNFQFIDSVEPHWPDNTFKFSSLLLPNGPFANETYREGSAAIRSTKKLRSLRSVQPDNLDGDGILFLEYMNKVIDGECKNDLVDRDELRELINFNQSLPIERRFLAILPDSLTTDCAPPVDHNARKFELTKYMIQKFNTSPQCAQEFVHHLDAGKRIGDAAFATYLKCKECRPEDEVFWMRLAACFGHRKALLELGLENCTHGDVRLMRNKFLKELDAI